MATKYKNLPVKEEAYEKVRMIADANGLGLGAQVEQWAARDLPSCEHKKEPVSIEFFPSNDFLNGTQTMRLGWYCPTCKRVYQRIETQEATQALLAANGTAVQAPYVHITPTTAKPKRRTVTTGVKA